MASGIPVNEPVFLGNEARYLAECIETGWVSSEGPFVGRFEDAFAEMAGRAHGIAVCNGSVALELALAALDIGSGDEVILPTFTIVSCLAAVLRAGATPVLVDSDPETWNMDVGQVAASIGERTKAILAVHTYGLPVDMDPVIELAAEHGLLVIEDAAEAHGLRYAGRPCGGFGDISTFSFYANKLVTTGEGGMVLTDDADLARRCRSLRNLCLQKGAKRFVHDAMGWNFRMSNIQAALGLAQLERLDAAVARKRAIGAAYTRLLEGFGPLQLPVPATAKARNLYWVYGVVLSAESGWTAEAAMERLAAHGVGTRPFFWPMHEQPVFLRMGLFGGARYPVAENLARRGLYLPSGLSVTDEQVRTVCRSLRSMIDGDGAGPPRSFP